MRRVLCAGAPASLLCIAPFTSQAHSFGTTYLLPIPLWMYAFGCVAVLVVTFAITGFFASAPAAHISKVSLPLFAPGWVRSAFLGWIGVLRVSAAGCLLLTIASGLAGSHDPASNIGMTLFWVVFLLGLTYLTLLVGDLYALINPWAWAVTGLERLGLDLTQGRLRYPDHLGDWPALCFYVALIWIELFVAPTPTALSSALLIYSVLTFSGAVLFGREVWLCHVEVFSVFFRIVGKLAPIEYVQGEDGRGWQMRLRPAFIGTLRERPEHLSTLVFVLFMLSSTTYDAVHDTVLWTGFYWRSMLWLLQPFWGTDLGRAQDLLMGGYLIYRQASLLVLPLLYLGLYLLIIMWAKALARSRMTLQVLAYQFCYSLIPIAIAYNFAHYFTFLIAQLYSFPRLLADPFDLGWNLFGLDRGVSAPSLQMNLIWHIEVAVLLIGHVVSVYLAHKIALRTFPTRRQALLSQLPLLMMMIAYTVVGLWILSLPPGAG